MIITVSRRFNLTRRRPPPLNVSNFSYFFSLSLPLSVSVPLSSYLFVLLAALKWDGWCVLFPPRPFSRPPSRHATVEMQFRTRAISSHIQYIYTYNIYRTTILLLYIQCDPFKCLRYALLRKVSSFIYIYNDLISSQHNLLKKLYFLKLIIVIIFGWRHTFLVSYFEAVYFPSISIHTIRIYNE